MITKIRENPALFELVRDSVADLLIKVDTRSLPYIREWEALVAAGPEACFKKALEDSEHAATLRSCTPFCGILTARERADFLEGWRAKYEAGRA